MRQLCTLTAAPRTSWLTLATARRASGLAPPWTSATSVIKHSRLRQVVHPCLILEYESSFTLVLDNRYMDVKVQN